MGYRKHWRRRLGRLLVWILPPLGLAAATVTLEHWGLLPQYLGTFLLALVLTKIGAVIAEPQEGLDGAIFVNDCIVMLAMALAAYFGDMLARGSGGGSVDPALVAVAGAYLMNLWPIAT